MAGLGYFSPSDQVFLSSKTGLYFFKDEKSVFFFYFNKISCWKVQDQNSNFCIFYVNLLFNVKLGFRNEQKYSLQKVKWSLPNNMVHVFWNAFYDLKIFICQHISCPRSVILVPLIDIQFGSRNLQKYIPPPKKLNGRHITSWYFEMHFMILTNIY